MTDEHDSGSGSPQQLPYYRPVEAALRWCGLIQYEKEILQALDQSFAPKAGQFPQWPRLRENTERILDAITCRDLRVWIQYEGHRLNMGGGPTFQTANSLPPSSIRQYRAGPPPGPNYPIRKTEGSRVLVQHADLREWMAKYYPDDRPTFLFGSDPMRTELERVRESVKALTAERDAMQSELDSLRALVAAGGPRERESLLRIVYSMACGEPYKFDAKAPRNEATAIIASATAAAGCSVDADTVRKYLKEAAEKFGSKRHAGR